MMQLKYMKNSIEQNLNSMGFSLPKKIKAAGSYVPFLKEGNFLFISGQLPIKNNKVLFSGKIDNKNNLLLNFFSNNCDNKILTNKLANYFDKFSLFIEDISLNSITKGVFNFVYKE